MFKQIPIFFRIFSPFKHGMKNKLSGYLVLVSEIVTFMSKRNFLKKFPHKCFKRTERNSLAVCGSLCGENQFLLIFIPLYWFDQKKVFKQIQIFLRICHFQTWLEKPTLWLFQCSFVRESLLCLKRKVLYEFPPKCFKTTEGNRLAVSGSLCGEKHFLLIFFPFTALIKNISLNKYKFSTGFARIKHG